MLFPRKLQKEIEEVLPRPEFIVITGARQTGKTSLMLLLKDYLEKQGQACDYLNLENPEYLTALNQHPFNIFELLPSRNGRQTVFIDEIQYLDNPSNFLKLLYDDKRDIIRVIASGSSSFYIDTKFKDS